MLNVEAGEDMIVQMGPEWLTQDGMKWDASIGFFDALGFGASGTYALDLKLQT